MPAEAGHCGRCGRQSLPLPCNVEYRLHLTDRETEAHTSTYSQQVGTLRWSLWLSPQPRFPCSGWTWGPAGRRKVCAGELGAQHETLLSKSLALLSQKLSFLPHQRFVRILSVRSQPWPQPLVRTAPRGRDPRGTSHTRARSDSWGKCTWKGRGEKFSHCPFKMHGCPAATIL